MKRLDTGFRRYDDLPSFGRFSKVSKRELLKRVVLVGKKPATVDLPIAFNDPPGDYEISITELFTNKTVTKELSLQ